MVSSCQPGFSFEDGGCTEGKTDSSSTKTAELVTVLIPATAGAVLTLSLALLCCAWASKTQTRLKRELRNNMKQEQVDVENENIVMQDKNGGESSKQAILTDQQNSSRSAPDHTLNKLSNGTASGQTLQNASGKLDIPSKDSMTSQPPEITISSPAKPTQTITAEEKIHSIFVVESAASAYQTNMDNLMQKQNKKDDVPKRTVSIDHIRRLNSAGSLMPTDESLFNNLRPNSVSSYTYGRAYSPINLDGPEWMKNRMRNGRPLSR